MSRSLPHLLALLAILTLAQAAAADEPGQDDSAPDPPAATQPQVVLFMTSWCHYCRLTSSYLREKGVSFVERDIEADRTAMAAYFKAGGGGGVPMVVIGDTAIMGFDTGAIDRALAALPPAEDEPETEEPTPSPKAPPGGKWPRKTIRGELTDIAGDVHEPEVTFITTRRDVLDEVETDLSRSFVGEIIGETPDVEEEEVEEKD